MSSTISKIAYEKRDPSARRLQSSRNAIICPFDEKLALVTWAYSVVGVKAKREFHVQEYYFFVDLSDTTR